MREAVRAAEDALAAREEESVELTARLEAAEAAAVAEAASAARAEERRRDAESRLRSTLSGGVKEDGGQNAQLLKTTQMAMVQLEAVRAEVQEANVAAAQETPIDVAWEMDALRARVAHLDQERANAQKEAAEAVAARGEAERLLLTARQSVELVEARSRRRSRVRPKRRRARSVRRAR